MKSEPLKISCSTADCESGLHCFKKNQRIKSDYPNGICQKCGADLIDWNRLRQRKISDVHNTIKLLKIEWIRHHYWEDEPMSKYAVNYARRKGKTKLKEKVAKHLGNAVGTAQPFNDGRQTPFGSIEKPLRNPIHYAQHAVAACCRKCIKHWHGIDPGRDLSGSEIQYLTDLVMCYIEEKIPDLAEDSIAVPVIRQPRTGE